MLALKKPIRLSLSQGAEPHGPTSWQTDLDRALCRLAWDGWKRGRAVALRDVHRACPTASTSTIARHAERLIALGFLKAERRGFTLANRTITRGSLMAAIERDGTPLVLIEG